MLLPHKIGHSAKLISAALALTLLHLPARAQNPVPNNDTGIHDHQMYVGDRESINPLTGNLNVQIPLLHLPGRAGHDLDLTMSYNSNIWYFFQFTDPRGMVHSEWIPMGAYPFGGDSFNLGVPSMTSQVGPSFNDTCTGNFVVGLPDGSKHFFNFGNSGVQINCYNTSTGISDPASNVPKGEDLDGFILLDTTTSTVTLRNGTKYHFSNNSGDAISSEDRNGNIINYSGNCGGSSCFIDSAGRQVISGPNTLSYTDDNGTPQTFTFAYTTVNISATTSSFPYTPQLYSPGWSVSNGNTTMLSSITFPNNTSYTFQYDPTYGELTKITYPTGGYTRYEYGNFPVGRYVINAVNQFQPNNARYVTAKHVCRSASGTCATEDTTTFQPQLNGNYPDPVTITNTITNPDATQVVTTGGCPGSTTKFYAASGALLRTVSRTAAFCHGNNPGAPASETVTLDDGKQTTTSWTYDTYTEPAGVWSGGGGTGLDDPIDVKVTDYSGSVIRETKTTYNTTYRDVSHHILDLPTQVQILNGSGNLVAQTTNGYDESTFPLVNPSSTIFNHDSAYNTSFAQRGNLTSVTKLLQGGSSLVTYSQYDIAGNTVMHKDPGGHVTNFDYTDRFGSNTTCAPPSGQNTYAYLAQITNALNQSITKTYNSCSGTLASGKDLNNLTTTHSYDMMHRRTQSNFPDVGQDTACFSEVSGSTCYSASLPLSVTRTQKISLSPPVTRTSKSIADGLGRVIQTQVSDPQGTVLTDTTYDALGRVATVSNPYRQGTDPTTSAGTTGYFYDALGRKCLEVPPDGTLPTGGVCPTTQPANTIFTTYSGNCTTVTDQTGKSRKSCSDALGRLIQVFEDPANLNYETDYTYDAPGNLLTVNQKGGTTDTTKWRTRTFTYDSLSRLLTSYNPEVGTITYNYDADTNCASPNSFAGLLVSKTDARGIRTCYQYEVLNREVVRNYSNGDPTITTAYDGSNCLGLTNPPCSNIGHRTSMTDAAGSESWAYQVDTTNFPNSPNIHRDQRTTNGITKSSTYYADLANNVAQVVYPTGRVVNYTYDSADHPSTAIDGSNGITYATDFQTAPTGCLTGKVCYTPQGTFYALSVGQSSSFTGLNLTHSYNSRLQPNEFKASSTGGNAMDISYNFVDPATSHNGGHVYAITNNLDATRSQTFAYDQLNRITAAQTASTFSTSPGHCWGETYQFDNSPTSGAWGNLTQIAATTNPAYTGCSQESGFAANADGNNHLNIFSYDVSGNTQNDGTFSYNWDAESQLKSAGGVTYAYDGDGRRVSKSNGKLYWYGSGGDILAETDASGNTTAEYIFFGGKRIAMIPYSSSPAVAGPPIYYVEDLLGTSRVITTNSGVVCYDADFYPYGGERSYTNTCPQNYKFEGKERDTETGNDDFGARYYSNRFGRWLSADWSAVPVPVPYANLTNPQTLNLYSMVADDPETFSDLDGHNAGTADDCRNHPACFENCPPTTIHCSVSSTDSEQQSAAQGAAQQPQETNSAVQFAKDEAIGMGKELANTVIGLTNFIDDGINALLGTSLQTQEFKASTPGEKSAMLGTSLALLLVPGGGETKVLSKGEKIAQLTADAEKLYPKLAGKLQDHHIIPQYLGGAKDGATARIPAAYHQLITNAFRERLAYGVKHSAEAVQQVIKEVYRTYPLP